MTWSKPVVSGERQRTLVIYIEKCLTLRREKAGENSRQISLNDLDF